MSQYVKITSFNQPLNLTNILKTLTLSKFDWEVCIHSFNIQLSNKEILHILCDHIEYDHNLKKPILITAYSNEQVNVKVLRWKKLLIKDMSNFKLNIRTLDNNKTIPDNTNNYILLVFRPIL